MTAVKVEKSYEDPAALSQDEVVFDITNYDEFVLGPRERLVETLYAAQEGADVDRRKVAEDYRASMLAALDDPGSWPILGVSEKGESELQVVEDRTLILPGAMVAGVFVHVTDRERAERYRAMEQLYCGKRGVTLDTESLLAIGGPLDFYQNFYQGLPVGFLDAVPQDKQAEDRALRLVGRIDHSVEAFGRYGKIGTVSVSRAIMEPLTEVITEQMREENIFIEASMHEYRVRRWLAMDKHVPAPRELNSDPLSD